MKNIKKSGIVLMLAAVILEGCAVIRPGEIGITQHLGRLRGSSVESGVRWYNPFSSRVIKVNIRTVEVFNNLPLPTKEGLSVNAEISLLYHVKPEAVRDVYIKFGRGYEETAVLSNFRATAREISARYYAKELYATERNKVEQAIADELAKHIEQYGFVIDAVLLKDIILPPQMVQAIEAKVTAEQAALQMDFVIQKQKKEAERMIIEANAIKESQQIINSSLTELLIKYDQIQMLKGLTNSPNSKVIVTNPNGETNMMVNTDPK
jgi:regulator of protease activity HflC (stomatin/prohibitin superfamily)